jgi:group I intron endonuclease
MTTKTPKICGVYSITSPSGNAYIGSSNDIKKRWAGHRLALRKGTHHNAPLLRAFRNYGADALVYKVVEECLPELRKELEATHITLHREQCATYNATAVVAGQECSPAYREMMQRINKTKGDNRRIAAGKLPFATPEERIEAQKESTHLSAERLMMTDPEKRKQELKARSATYRVKRLADDLEGFKAKKSASAKATRNRRKLEAPAMLANLDAKNNKRSRDRERAKDPEGYKAKTSAAARATTLRIKSADPEAYNARERTLRSERKARDPELFKHKAAVAAAKYYQKKKLAKMSRVAH